MTRQLLLLLLCASTASAFVVTTTVQPSSSSLLQQQLQQQQQQRRRRVVTLSSSSSSLYSSNKDANNDSNNDNDNSQDEIDRTTFDQAGASLIEEEDKKRMDEMGDFDANPAYQNDSIEKMRAAIRARTEDLGIAKSKVSADYIQSRQEKAVQAGAQQDREDQAGNTFGGVDLSKISNDGSGTTTQWDEDMPTMFFDPDEQLSEDEQKEVDPVMTKNVMEQGLNELTNAKWPTIGAAGREVVLMAAVVAFSGVLIIGADTLLRTLYTDVLKFIPSADELANYAQRFDGLDLPSGWMDNMSENDMASLTDQVNTVGESSSSSSGGGGLPGL